MQLQRQKRRGSPVLWRKTQMCMRTRSMRTLSWRRQLLRQGISPGGSQRQVALPMYTGQPAQAAPNRLGPGDLRTFRLLPLRELW